MVRRIQRGCRGPSPAGRRPGLTRSRLVVREILHRRLNFVLGLVPVVVAVTAYGGAVALLRGFDLETARMADALEARSRAEMDRLEDEMRKSMKGLGFNICIYPAGQEMGEVYARGYASKTMPEHYATTLAESGIVTVNHLLPSLTRKLTWPEEGRTIVLVGVRGEVPIAHRDPKAPLVEPVPRDRLVMGYELHRGLGLEPGDPVRLLGQPFVVETCHAERGSVDDITVWMNLGQAQELLGMPGQINAILALECNCSTVDRLAEVRREILSILPGTQVVEKGSQALARAEARTLAAETARSRMAELAAQRSAAKRRHEELAAVLVPLVAVFSMVAVGLLAWTNVRERLREIAVLRAVGLRSRTLVGLFLSRAAVLGLAGAGLGLALCAGLAAGPLAGRLQGAPLSALLPVPDLLGIVLLTPCLAAAAAWLPVLAAARQDPAVVLRHDG